MRSTLRAFALAVMLGAFVAPGATLAQALTPAQTKQVEDIVRRTLLDNPRIILEAIEALKKEQEVADRARQKSAVKDKRAELERDADDPVAGNPEGDVTVVEFFDYRCPYCKVVAGRLMDAAKADGKVRIVFKELPILGPESVFAARAALAARKQGKYLEFHMALMQAKERLGDEATLRIAGQVGLDLARLKRDMAEAEITRTIDKVTELAEALGISGTPAFVVGEALVPGAIDRAGLDKLVAEARKAK
jgi:protein-disulfide isomerase